MACDAWTHYVDDHLLFNVYMLNMHADACLPIPCHLPGYLVNGVPHAAVAPRSQGTRGHAHSDVPSAPFAAKAASFALNCASTSVPAAAFAGLASASSTAFAEATARATPELFEAALFVGVPSSFGTGSTHAGFGVAVAVFFIMIASFGS